MARSTSEVHSNQEGQAITDYTVLLVVILLLLVGVAHMAGNRVHGLFSNVVDAFQQQPRND